MAQADPALFGDGAGNGEGLQPFADHGGGFFGGGHPALKGQRRAHRVGPTGIVETDGLDAADDAGDVDALVIADFFGILQGSDAVIREHLVDFVDSSFVTFK